MMNEIIRVFGFLSLISVGAIYPFGAQAQDVGVPGIFEFHGPLSQGHVLGPNDWRSDKARWEREFHAHHRYWRGDVWMCPVHGGWEECE